MLEKLHQTGGNSGYDQMRRLAQAWTATDNCATTPTSADKTMVGNTLANGSAYWTSWSFDDLGNRTGQTQHNLSGLADKVISYKYNGNGAGQPHTLTKTTVTGGVGGTSYTYDTAGNENTRTARDTAGNQTLTWTDTGKLSTVTNANGTSTSIYNADGSLLLQKDPAATTLYLGGEQLVLNTATGAVSGTRYISLPGGATAIRSGTGTNYCFTVGDQHGTPNLYLDSTAQTPTWRQYTPYGEPRGATIEIPDNHGFLNKPQKNVTGLTHVGAREYDATTGRFISIDPVQTLTDPQQWNGYAYANNSPVSNWDPSGLCNPDICNPSLDHTGAPPASSTPPPGEDPGNHGSANNGGGGHHGSGGFLNSVLSFAHKHPTITGIIVGTVVDVGCNAALDVETAGVGAVACAVVAGAAGSAVQDWAQGGVSTSDMLQHALQNGAISGTLAVVGPAAPGLATGARSLIGNLGRKAAAAVARDAAENLLGRDVSQNVATKIAKTAEACLISHSFAPNTAVLLADGSTKPIADVEEGDKVLAADPDNDTTQGEPVTALHSNHDTELTDITVKTDDGRTTTLHTTQHHPFWSTTKDEWVDAADLKAGEHLTPLGRGPAVVKVVRNFSGGRNMRDLTVALLHTYYVLAGKTPVLVHNVGCGSVSYGSTDLSKAAIEFRRNPLNRVGSGQNVAVYRVKMPDGSIQDLPFANNVRGAHSEANADDALANLGVKPGDVLEIYSERNFCTTAGHECAGRMAQFPNAKLSWTFENGDNAGLSILKYVYGDR